MREIGVYIKERFPLPLVLLLAVGYGLFIVGIASSAPHNHLAAAAIIVAFIAFLLRQRITDEWKDLRHDSKNYPNRPFQRGLVTAKQLVGLGVFALVLELAAVYIAGSWFGLAWYLPLLAFSALMSVEFFASTWLTKHFTTYFVVHQFVFVAFIAWVFAVFETPITAATICGAIALLLTMASVEIVRKFEVRRDSTGAIVADTYPTVWGRTQSVAIMAGLILISGLLLAIFAGSPLHFVVALVATLIIGAAYTSNIAVRVTGALVFIIQAAGVYFL